MACSTSMTTKRGDLTRPAQSRMSSTPPSSERRQLVAKVRRSGRPPWEGPQDGRLRAVPARRNAPRPLARHPCRGAGHGDVGPVGDAAADRQADAGDLPDADGVAHRFAAGGRHPQLQRGHASLHRGTWALPDSMPSASQRKPAARRCKRPGRTVSTRAYAQCSARSLGFGG